jgi:hypothetical protein
MLARELIENPADCRPHVVVLGAGASLAAFPNGDARGRHLPLMRDLAELIGLAPVFTSAGIEQGLDDFEAAFALLASRDDLASTRAHIETSVHAYFAAMELPETATLYDRLVLSLRPCDAILTFNWDPFLFDAFDRNRHIAAPPLVYFLHGNVRIGACDEHPRPGLIGGACRTCGKSMAPVPLLYPVGNKDYTSNAYIAAAWSDARELLAEALTLTVFGYAAPVSDAAAVSLLGDSWFSRSSRQFEHMQVIDIAPSAELHRRWSKFLPTGHLHPIARFEDSWLSLWPRRANQALLHTMRTGMPSAAFPLAQTHDLQELQRGAANIAAHEGPRGYRDLSAQESASQHAPER